MTSLMLLCLLFLFSFTLAVPFDTRTVYAPPITSPTSTTVWTVGEVETVTWDATGIPPGVKGMIMLGYLNPGSTNEHLNATLASGFNLTDEKVDVTVPAVVGRKSYIVVLFGDSGNISDEFEIKEASASGSSKPVSSASHRPSVSGIRPSAPISGIITITTSATSTFSFTSSAPSSTATGPSSPPASVSPSGSTPPLPAPSGAAWRMTLNVYQVFLLPVTLLFVL
ncbi:hypothetical protein C8J57DRAFT_1115512 [Mycena rebaudengoi]|nr:hypothetical protein C8J57DRAFT_1115512 [Mycena rebaudengoi]